MKTFKMQTYKHIVKLNINHPFDSNNLIQVRNFTNKLIIVMKTKIGIAVMLLIAVLCIASVTSKKQIIINVESVETVSMNPELYHGWPTVIRTVNGDLLAVCSGGRDAHLCPFGRIEMIRSKDNGKTWSAPEILANTPLDDRDPYVFETNKGTLLVGWFTWKREFIINTDWPQEKQYRWQKAIENRTAANCSYSEIMQYMKRIEQGDKSLPWDRGHRTPWQIRSEDGGKSWSEPYHVALETINGPILTKDGRLLLAGRMPARVDKANEMFLGVAESFDDGKTWVIIGQIPPYPGHDPHVYLELHIVECANGNLVVQFRNRNELYRNETLQSSSYDGGKTWTVPHSTGIWGDNPSHLLRLPDGKLLMSYGHRGDSPETRHIYVRFSNNCGKNWSQPYSLADNFPNWDMGYPTTTILPDGKFLTFWYQRLPGNDKAQLVRAIWNIL